MSSKKSRNCRLTHGLVLLDELSPGPFTARFGLGRQAGVTQDVHNGGAPDFVAEMPQLVPNAAPGSRYTKTAFSTPPVSCGNRRSASWRTHYGLTAHDLTGKSAAGHSSTPDNPRRRCRRPSADEESSHRGHPPPCPSAEIREVTAATIREILAGASTQGNQRRVRTAS